MKQLNSIRLESSRLYVFPLSYDQLLVYTKATGTLESASGLLSFNRTLNEDLLLTVEKSAIPYIIQHPRYHLYGTLWVIVNKKVNQIIGDIGFKGAPTEKGLIEVGYGIYPDFAGRGFMTEALGLMVQWAFEQTGISIILAETDKMNIASQHVLQKNSFIPFAEMDTMYWWRLDKNPEIIN